MLLTTHDQMSHPQAMLSFTDPLSGQRCTESDGNSNSDESRLRDDVEFTLDAVQLADHRQRDIGTQGLALGLYFWGLDELASRMGHAS